MQVIATATHSQLLKCSIRKVCSFPWTSDMPQNSQNLALLFFGKLVVKYFSQHQSQTKYTRILCVKKFRVQINALGSTWLWSSLPLIHFPQPLVWWSPTSLASLTWVDPLSSVLGPKACTDHHSGCPRFQGLSSFWRRVARGSISSVLKFPPQKAHSSRTCISREGN